MSSSPDAGGAPPRAAGGGSGKRASAKVYVDNSQGPSSTAAAAAATAAAVSPEAVPPTTRKRVTLRLSHDISTEQLFTDQLIDGRVPDGEDDEEDDEDAAPVAAAVAVVAATSASASTTTTTPADEDPAPLRPPPSSPSSRSKRHSGGSRRHHSGHRKSPKATKGAMATNGEQPPPSDGGVGGSEQDDTGHAQDGGGGRAMYRIESHSHLSSLDARHMEKRGLSEDHARQTTTTTTRATAPSSGRLTLAPLPSTPSDATGGGDDSAVCAKCRSHPEMPPLHCAAYSGHDACLAGLLAETDGAEAAGATTSTTSSLDKKHRTPLFYACAANRLGCVDRLVRARPAWRDLPDRQLDTPVHVCCFFGWDACLARLLDAGADPHGRNAKGFKPSHIAKTKACLELLLGYGDDLLQGDKLGRTPLFVAAARDRVPCVEFLCEWNHQTRSWMLEQEDERGDRPIHAAACNGSAGSLAVLLRFGADPLSPNAKGLTPRDLAEANHHAPCVELLTRAEAERASTTWFAPANAEPASTSTPPMTTTARNQGTWIECWDNTTEQPFYYDNTSGKCQWEVPEGFEPQLLRLLQRQQQPQEPQQQQQPEEDDGEYVWVKKKKQTVCVVTGKASEWTAVQDPVSRAVYYRNTRTGQSQWEEPDAVQQLQSASASHASQQASQLWDELEGARTALARALAADRERQRQAHLGALAAQRQSLRQRRDDMRKKEETARLQQLLPRSSFVRRKKQSMMIKLRPDGQPESPDDERLEQICLREPSLDIFLSTYVRLHGVRDLQLSLERRFGNCLYHYYVALVDPVHLAGMSKSQFRTVLRDAGILPSTFAASAASSSSASAMGPHPTLKLHIVDLIFSQAARAEALETAALATASSFYAASAATATATATANAVSASHNGSHPMLLPHRQAAAAATAASVDRQLGVSGFLTGLQLVRERLVAVAEDDPGHDGDGGREIDDDAEWFLSTYVLPLTVRHGTRLLTQIRECKELDLALGAAPRAQGLLARNRQPIQSLHRFYTGLEPPSPRRMLTFRGLGQLCQDLGLAPALLSLAVLRQLYEAVNWISGNAHTEVISFEKLQQLLALIAVQTAPTPPVSTTATIATGTTTTSIGGVSESDPTAAGAREDALVAALEGLFRRLEAAPALHRVRAACSPSPVTVDPTNGNATATPFFSL